MEVWDCYQASRLANCERIGFFLVPPQPRNLGIILLPWPSNFLARLSIEATSLSS